MPKNAKKCQKMPKNANFRMTKPAKNRKQGQKGFHKPHRIQKNPSMEVLPAAPGSSNGPQVVKVTAPGFQNHRKKWVNNYSDFGTKYGIKLIK